MTRMFELSWAHRKAVAYFVVEWEDGPDGVLHMSVLGQASCGPERSQGLWSRCDRRWSRCDRMTVPVSAEDVRDATEAIYAVLAPAGEERPTAESIRGDLEAAVSRVAGAGIVAKGVHRG